MLVCRELVIDLLQNVLERTPPRPTPQTLHRLLQGMTKVYWVTEKSYFIKAEEAIVPAIVCCVTFVFELLDMLTL